MIEQQRNKWQNVPSSISDGEFPVIDVEQAVQCKEQQTAPSVVTSAHLPVIKPTPPVPHPSPLKKDDDDEYHERRRFFNQVAQPALEGLMDGSLSSLAPIFLTIFMTRQTLTTFLVGAGAALAGGISETFSESLSDDENLSERGNPFVHAGITGLFTFISGLIPALPFLIANYRLSLSLAYIVVILELTAISVIRCKFLRVKWWLSAIQIVGGGALVFIAAVLLGNA